MSVLSRPGQTARAGAPRYCPKTDMDVSASMVNQYIQDGSGWVVKAIAVRTRWPSVFVCLE